MVITEQEIVQGLKQGDKNAYIRLYRLYYSDMRIVTNRIVKDIIVAEEITQEFICKLWNNRETLQIPSYLKQYLFSEVHKTTLNYIRDKKNTQEIDVQRQDIASYNCLESYNEL